MTIRGVGVAAVFLVGCAVGGVSSQLAVPKASAQQAAAVTNWQYFYVGWRPILELARDSNRMGAEGWEMTSVETSGERGAAWFKRPKL